MAVKHTRISDKQQMLENCLAPLNCITLYNTKTFTGNETITPEWQNLFQSMHISLRPDKLVLQAARQTVQAGRLRTN